VCLRIRIRIFIFLRPLYKLSSLLDSGDEHNLSTVSMPAELSLYGNVVVYNALMQDREKEGYWYITIGDVFNQEPSVQYRSSLLWRAGGVF